MVTGFVDDPDHGTKFSPDVNGNEDTEVICVRNVCKFCHLGDFPEMAHLCHLRDLPTKGGNVPSQGFP